MGQGALPAVTKVLYVRVAGCMALVLPLRTAQFLRSGGPAMIGERGQLPSLGARPKNVIYDQGERYAACPHMMRYRKIQDRMRSGVADPHCCG